jgi:hypothetical protein
MDLSHEPEITERRAIKKNEVSAKLLLHIVFKIKFPHLYTFTSSLNGTLFAVTFLLKQ